MSIMEKKVIDVVEIEKNKKDPSLRSMGALDITLMGVGAIVGSGILVLTGVVAATTSGPAVIFSFLLAAFVCGLVGLCYAEVAATIPISGSAYIYTYASMGKLVGYLTGWLLTGVYMTCVAAVASGWTGYLSNLLNGVGIIIPEALTKVPADGGVANLPGAIAILLVTIMLSQGTKESKKFNNAMVGIKIFVILLFCVVAAFYIKPSNWTPFAPFGIKGVLTGASTAFFAFIGFDILATSVEDVKNPQKDLPRGMVATLIVCAILYVVVSLIMTGVLKYTELNVPEAMSLVLESVGQHGVAGVVSLGAVIGLLAVLFALCYAVSRVVMSMSRDGLLPTNLSKLSSKDSPNVIIWGNGILCALITAFFDIHILVNISNSGMLIIYMLVCASVIILRKLYPNIERSFKTPLVPFIPILSILILLFLFVRLPFVAFIPLVAWLVIGLITFFLYANKNSNKKHSCNK
ncbi:APA family basic amino acid/polyamine antiporter [Clostridioides mangenotii]|uniref:APA family basic amino acid/polyamine antiporter n=2 Tax=Metaclostridioides mangenotii TaxID=1540 RepID=A0ABS4EAX5_9FIRM|nr:APA family basic amino acid/polyamine antiporter [Clostridioides mangenotii]